MSVHRRPERTLGHVYDAAYAGVPNWDVGYPQRPFVHLVEGGLVDGPVLDVGCGTGELSLFLAQHDYDVLGIDLSALAIRQARAKAEWRRVPAAFLVWDALDLDGLAGAGFRFWTVFDSAMFHVLGHAERDRFVSGLESVVPSGGRYCVLGDARRHPDDVYGLTPRELRDRFDEAEWRLLLAEETVFERRWGDTPAYFVCLQRR